MITDQMLNKYKIGAQMNECLMYSGRSSNFRTRGVGWGVRMVGVWGLY